MAIIRMFASYSAAKMLTYVICSFNQYAFKLHPVAADITHMNVKQLKPFNILLRTPDDDSYKKASIRTRGCE